MSKFLKKAKNIFFNSPDSFESFILKISQNINLDEDIKEDIATENVTQNVTQDIIKGRVINTLPGKGLNLRAEPTEFSTIKKILPKNTAFVFLGDRQNYRGVEFIKVSVGGAEGWVASNFVEYFNSKGSLLFRGEFIESTLKQEEAPNTDGIDTSDWKSYAPYHIKRISEKYSIPEAVAFAQFALESNFGKSHINGFNFFGIKGVGNAGSSFSKTKEEFEPNNQISIRDTFKKNKTIEEGFDSYGRLLRDSTRYNLATEKYYELPAKFVIWIWANGYATDSKYPEKLSAISKKIASELDRQDLVISFSEEEIRFINYLATLQPKDRAEKISKIRSRTNTSSAF